MSRYGHREVPIYLSGYFPEYDWGWGPQNWEEDREYHIDEKIAHLVELCWKYGVRTAGSCQGGPGGGPGSSDDTLICFAQRKDLWLFRRLVGGFRPGWTWQGDRRKFAADAGKWAVFFPPEQIAAATRTVRAFGPFYGHPPKPPVE